MKSIRQVLVHINDSPRSRKVALLAASLAAAHGATLAALHAVESPTAGAYLSPEASALAAQLTRDAVRGRLDQARALVEGVASECGIDLPFESTTGDPLAALLRRAHCTDLLVLGQRDPEQPDGNDAGFPGRLLVRAGCPLLFVPYASDFVGGPPSCGRRVLVAWSGSRESARALRDALPLLERADHVELLRYTRPGDGADDALDVVAAHLRRHGIEAKCTLRHGPHPTIAERMLPRWTPDAPVAEALLSHAADCDADLIVTGGYGHPRAWELALGGVTRTLLQSMTVPVLMSH
ncbi:MAG: universal stress protein [Rubrivivax sp.]|nr:universal stress protein [Rubrivivax sp.]